MRRCFVFSLVNVTLLLSTASVASAQGENTNALADLPSQAGSQIEQIEKLGDNEWLNLGQAEADPKWGTARGRAWCSKMAFAADLGGAFFCGTGIHGATPNGRYMDDLWFYDANAHRWICLYPGADPKSLKLHLDEHGFEVDAEGRSVPVSYLSHAYCNTTYNSDLKLYHIMWTQCPWWTKALPQRWGWLDESFESVRTKNYGNPGPVITAPKHPLFWSVNKSQWERKFVAGPGPEKRFEGVAEYIPSLKKTLYTYRGRTYLYDYATNSWSTGATVPASVAGYDSNGCFDAKHQRVYVARGKGFTWYDVKDEMWHKENRPGQPEDFQNTNRSQLFYDSANDVVLWHRSHGNIVIYDPEDRSWTDLGNTTPKIPWKRFNSRYMTAHGFYDANLNVHFFYLAGDSNNVDATMLAYRYKRAKSK